VEDVVDAGTWQQAQANNHFIDDFYRLIGPIVAWVYLVCRRRWQGRGGGGCVVEHATKPSPPPCRRVAGDGGRSRTCWADHSMLAHGLGSSPELDAELPKVP
jgi:hypothetical protein